MRPLVIATCLVAALPALGAPQQGGPPPASPVRYTPAREQDVHRAIRLPGTVRSRTLSLVATQVEGYVEEYPAREGRTVRKGETLARLRTTMLELQRNAATAQLEEAESRLKLAKIQLDRTRGLFEQQVASQQDFDNALYDHNAWEGRRADLEARIAQIDLAIDLCRIVAPFAGMVVSERTEIGQWLRIGDPVVELIALDELEVHVDVPERYFSELNPGATAHVVFDAVPDLAVDGRITAIIARADPEARTFPMKVSIPSTGGRIGVGMLASVSFTAGESYRAMVVPKDAVVRQAEGEVVYRINGSDTVEMVPVKTGEGVGAWIVVVGDISAGQKIITRGNERIFPGMPVSGEPLEYALP